MPISLGTLYLANQVIITRLASYLVGGKIVNFTIIQKETNIAENSKKKIMM